MNSLSTSNFSKVSLGIFFVLMSSLFISIETLAVDFLYRNFDYILPLEIFFWSCFGAVLFSFPYFICLKKSRIKIKRVYSKHKKFLIINSLISSFAAFMFFIAIYLIGSGTTSLLNKSSFLFAILFGILFLKERIDLKDSFLILLVLIGFIIFQEDYSFNSILGIFAAISSAFGYAVLLFLLKKESREDFYSFHFMYLRQIGTLIVSGIFVVLFLILNYEFKFIGFENFIILSLASISGGIISRAFRANSLTLIDLSLYSVVQNIQIIIVLLGTVLFFSDTYSAVRIFGVFLVIFSIILFILKNRK